VEVGGLTRHGEGGARSVVLQAAPFDERGAQADDNAGLGVGTAQKTYRHLCGRKTARLADRDTVCKLTCWQTWRRVSAP
jgi:hypothetical protein